MRIGSRDGFMLITSYALMVFFMGMLAVMSVRVIGSNITSTYQRLHTKALYCAQAGIERVKTELYNGFMEHFYGASGAWTDSSFTWFDGVANGTGQYSFPVSGTVGDGSYEVTLERVEPLDEDVGRLVILKSVGRVRNMTVTLEVGIRYGLARSKVFDYAYFINNYGWFWGNSITVNGDVRSNGDFSLRYDPKVNGDVYAGVDPELGSSGDISGTNRWDDLSTYYSTASDRARPGNPSAPSEDANGNGVLDLGEDLNGNGVLDTYTYPSGYDGDSQHYAHQTPVNMPYLGDLEFYKTVATTKGGTLKIGGSTVINGVYDGNLILVGTDANPIEIDGPVVVTGDVLIKGKVKGQGVIYAGRNVHILGNVEYVDPPSWPKPDYSPADTDTANANKDFLGLAAKGNVIIGDYTDSAWDSPKYYLSPYFTSPYKVDATDAGNGYVSYYDADGNPWFDGDYTDYDGGKKEDGSNRRYYESSFKDSTVRQLADSYSQITQIDAFIYTNHAMAGRVGAITFNGGIVARDEAIISSGYIIMNYDVRVKDERFRDKFYLPRDLDLPRVWSWKEL